MRLIWVEREAEYFLTEDWTAQITLNALAFLALCRTPQILGERAAGQGFWLRRRPDPISRRR
jgi:hypothetical protein